MLILADYAFTGVALLANDVAENAAFFFVVVVPAIIDFFAHAPRNNGKRNQLRMRMLQGSAGSFAMIFENENVANRLSFFKSSMRSR